MSKNENNKKKGQVIIVLIVLLIILGIGIAAALIVGDNSDTKADSGLENSQEAVVIPEADDNVYVDDGGNVYEGDAVPGLEEGEELVDIEIPEIDPADFVEPGEGTLDIGKIQGFSEITQSENSEDEEDSSDADDNAGNGNTSNGNSGNEDTDDSDKGNSDGSDEEDPGDSGEGGSAGNTDEEQEPVANPVLSDGNLVVESIGSYTGNFLEDGSDTPIVDVAAMLVTNNSSQMLQVGQIDFKVNDSETATFLISNLPAGTSVLVLEKNGRTYNSKEDYSYGNVTSAYMDSASTHSDKFDISMEDGKVILKNKTDKTYSKIYVYYKYVQIGGAYKGGITYRTLLENVASGATAEAVASHMNPSSSRVVDIRYAE